MKIIIDTDAKTVTISDNVTLSSIIEAVRGLSPDDWGEYTITVNKCVYREYIVPIYDKRDNPLTPPWEITSGCDFNIQY